MQKCYFTHKLLRDPRGQYLKFICVMLYAIYHTIYIIIHKMHNISATACNEKNCKKKVYYTSVGDKNIMKIQRQDLYRSIWNSR